MAFEAKKEAEGSGCRRGVRGLGGGEEEEEVEGGGALPHAFLEAHGDALVEERGLAAEGGGAEGRDGGWVHSKAGWWGMVGGVGVVEWCCPLTRLYKSEAHSICAQQPNVCARGQSVSVQHKRKMPRR